jgi:hypothetical protein
MAAMNKRLPDALNKGLLDRWMSGYVIELNIAF